MSKIKPGLPFVGFMRSEGSAGLGTQLAKLLGAAQIPSGGILLSEDWSTGFYVGTWGLPTVPEDGWRRLEFSVRREDTGEAAGYAAVDFFPTKRTRLPKEDLLVNLSPDESKVFVSLEGSGVCSAMPVDSHGLMSSHGLSGRLRGYRGRDIAKLVVSSLLVWREEQKN